MKEYKMNQEAVDKLAAILHDLPFKYANAVIGLLNASLVELKEEVEEPKKIKVKKLEEIAKEENKEVK